MSMPTRIASKHGKFVCYGIVIFVAVLISYICLAQNKNLRLADGQFPAGLPFSGAEVEPDENAWKPSVSSNIATIRSQDDDQEQMGSGGYHIELMTVTDIEAPPEADGIKYDVQSPARPFGLDIVAPVQIAGSDETSADFMEYAMLDILNYIESNIVHSSSVELISQEADPSNLVLEHPADVRVYFINEEASYHNSLGVNFEDDRGPKLVFPDASTMYSYLNDEDTMREYTSEDCPLVPGDFVDIGSVDAGSVLDFFIIPRGAHEATEVYGIETSLNEDQTCHMRVLGMVGESVIVLGFEDLKNGGDRDYDDPIIAVDIGANNIRSISTRSGL